MDMTKQNKKNKKDKNIITPGRLRSLGTNIIQKIKHIYDSD